VETEGYLQKQDSFIDSDLLFGISEVREAEHRAEQILQGKPYKRKLTFENQRL
jgi:hypothetical protein